MSFIQYMLLVGLLLGIICNEPQNIHGKVKECYRRCARNQFSYSKCLQTCLSWTNEFVEETLEDDANEIDFNEEIEEEEEAEEAENGDSAAYYRCRDYCKSSYPKNPTQCINNMCSKYKF